MFPFHILAIEPEPAPAPGVAVTIEGRQVFRRMEQNAMIRVAVSNSWAAPVTDCCLSAAIAGSNLTVNQPADEIAASGGLTVEIPVDTAWKPGVYDIKLDFTGQAGDAPVNFVTNVAMTIVPRPIPNKFPVMLWGFANPELARETGFTHAQHWMPRAPFRQIRKNTEPASYLSGDRISTALAALDKFLAAGVQATVKISPCGYDAVFKDYQRVDRDGQPYARANVCGGFPEIQSFAYNAGGAMALMLGSHPAFVSALIHTEVRDSTQLCFHEHDVEAYRRFSGQDIPPEAVNKDGLGRKLGPSFVPVTGIVPDDDPVLAFYRWFWKEGDGWNILHTKVNAGLKEHGVCPEFFAFHDPVVRAPPLWGSGGELDVISHWTYTYPDPPRMALAADELFAMAAGRPGQRVMKMTQIIWYRNGTAPSLPNNKEDRADWENESPDARFITIAPDHLREAFWLKISRPVRGIMYFGTGALFGGGKQQSCTNPETRKTLTHLVRTVVEPLGPTLMQVTNAPCDVAMLESFTSGVFGGQWTWGWARGWPGSAHQMLQWARLQPCVVYEETILRDNLDGIRVLVMPDCAALPRSVCGKIQAFQRRGGLVVADRNLAPALTPDILIPAGAPGGAPDRNKAGLQAMAEQLRADLAPVYDWYADSSDADVLVYRRAYKDTDYLFAVNDKREYGDYVGHHRKVMEQGVPCSATLTLCRTGGYVYDLTEQLEGEPVVSRPLPVCESPRKISWPAEFGPGGGRLYMITTRPIEAVSVEAAERAPEDRRVELRVRVTDGAGAPVDAVVPVEVRINDPAGNEAEYSGWYGARDGVQDIVLDMAENDARGTWTVKVHELATGAQAETRFEY